MTDYEEEIRHNLENDWGAAAAFSDYRPGETIRYRTESGTYSGIILWVAAPSESRIEGHDPLNLRYIVQRSGWSGFPDVVYSGDIIVT